MEENTVLLSLKEYNSLRDFKRTTEENEEKFKFKVIRADYTLGRYYETMTYYTKDEVVLKLANENKLLIERIGELNSKIDELEDKLNVEKNMWYHITKYINI